MDSRIQHKGEKEMKIYFIKNTINEYDTTIRGYFSSLDNAKEALKKCEDWWRSKGTGRIYEVELDTLNSYPKLVYEV